MKGSHGPATTSSNKKGRSPFPFKQNQIPEKIISIHQLIVLLEGKKGQATDQFFCDLLIIWIMSRTYAHSHSAGQGRRISRLRQ
jgi:hypothetical protein